MGRKPVHHVSQALVGFGVDDVMAPVFGTMLTAEIYVIDITYGDQPVKATTTALLAFAHTPATPRLVAVITVAKSVVLNIFIAAVTVT